MKSSLERRIEKLEAAFGGNMPSGLTLEWWKENHHRPLEEWPITDEERATIRARLAQADETMTAFESTEDDYAER